MNWQGKFILWLIYISLLNTQWSVCCFVFLFGLFVVCVLVFVCSFNYYLVCVCVCVDKLNAIHCFLVHFIYLFE